MSDKRTCNVCRGNGWVPLKVYAPNPLRPITVCSPCPAECWKPKPMPDERVCAFCGETIPWEGYQGKSSATVPPDGSLCNRCSGRPDAVSFAAAGWGRGLPCEVLTEQGKPKEMRDE